MYFAISALEQLNTACLTLSSANIPETRVCITEYQQKLKLIAFVTHMRERNDM